MHAQGRDWGVVVTGGWVSRSHCRHLCQVKLSVKADKERCPFFQLTC